MHPRLRIGLIVATTAGLSLGVGFAIAPHPSPHPDLARAVDRPVPPTTTTPPRPTTTVTVNIPPVPLPPLVGPGQVTLPPALPTPSPIDPKPGPADPDTPSTTPAPERPPSPESPAAPAPAPAGPATPAPEPDPVAPPAAPDVPPAPGPAPAPAPAPADPAPAPAPVLGPAPAVPVPVVVRPAFAVEPRSLPLGSASSATITLASTGGAPLQWSVTSSDPAWLLVAEGRDATHPLPSGAKATITVKIDSRALGAGVAYAGKVNVETNAGSTSIGVAGTTVDDRRRIELPAPRVVSLCVTEHHSTAVTLVDVVVELANADGATLAVVDGAGVARPSTPMLVAGRTARLATTYVRGGTPPSELVVTPTIMFSVAVSGTPRTFEYRTGCQS